MSRKSRLKDKVKRTARPTNVGDPNSTASQNKPKEKK